MTTQQKTETLHLRIKPGVKSLIQELARRDSRSVANWLEAVALEKGREAKIIKNDEEL